MTAQTPKTGSSEGVQFVQKVWNWKAMKYLYAKDYNIKGFPIGKRR